MARAQDLGRGQGPEGHGGNGNPPSDRKSTDGNPSPKAPESKPESICTGLQRIAELARQSPEMAFTSLHHLIDYRLLEDVFEDMRKGAAPGADGRTKASYKEGLEGNLASLLERFRSASYRAPAVRRVHIPKGTGNETRPIGIPTFEDKLLQGGVATVLRAIYEQDFLDCSYGFRPRRSAHDALHALWKQALNIGRCWIVEVDIRKFFDTLDHARLRELLEKRVRDGVILRTISKWLHAGILEEGRLSYPTEGTPQGGVVSPLLANVYLHYVLDVWFEREIKPRLEGRAFLVRYADDFVMGFSSELDARRVLDVLPKRFGKYGLTIHPTKTRLVDFRRPTLPPGQVGRDERPETFDFLGFTHFWGRTRKGWWVIQRKTARKRFARGLRAVADYCRRHRHDHLADQRRMLCQKLRGHFQYYGIRGNWDRLNRFLRLVTRTWHKWLTRRSQRVALTWERFQKLLKHYPLPVPCIVHRI
jgi:RNA-directed DNA polymerase